MILLVHGLAAGCGFELTAGPGGADAAATDAATPRADARVDASSAPGCGFTLDGTDFATQSVCSGEHSQCAGSAALAGERGIFLTNAEPSDPQTGAFWRRVALPVGTPFTLTVDLSTHQPEGGGRIGVGYAVTLLQAEADDGVFPQLVAGEVSGMGIDQLVGFRGAAALVKTYNGNGEREPGVFALTGTGVPFGKLGNIPRQNDETFTINESTYQRLVIQGNATTITADLWRFAGPDFSAGKSIEQISFELGKVALTHIDYVGIAAARGDDDYAQSAHQLEAVSLVCNP